MLYACFQVEKHWSEKPLEKMTERDWRIFREDFNISYKGNPGTLPLRNWDEGNFPDPIKMVSKSAGNTLGLTSWTGTRGVSMQVVSDGQHVVLLVHQLSVELWG